MNHKLNSININELNNSMEGNEINTKKIIKLINGQYSNSFKNPFSNVMLKNTIIHQKIKTLSRIKKSFKGKKKPFKQKNLYINFSDLYEQNKQNANENNNFQTNNSINEDIFDKNLKNNGFATNKIAFRSRNMKSLKLLPASKTMKTHKIKSFSNKLFNNKYFLINNQRVKINKLNITINSMPKTIRLEDKTIQTGKIYLDKIEDYKNYEKMNYLNNNRMSRNNFNHLGNIKFVKTSQIYLYLKNSSSTLLKNRTKNEIIKSNDNNFYKVSSADKYNKTKNIDIKNSFLRFNNRNYNLSPISNSNKIYQYKNNHINIHTLLSLKK